MVRCWNAEEDVSISNNLFQLPLFVPRNSFRKTPMPFDEFFNLRLMPQTFMTRRFSPQDLYFSNLIYLQSFVMVEMFVSK